MNNFKQKSKFFVYLISICIMFVSCTYKSNDKHNDLLEENKRLEKKIAELEAVINNEKKGNSIKKNRNDIIKLREGEILLYSNYGDGEEFLFKPACGPVAWLNPYAININNDLTILDQDDDFAKVSIIGIIPSWYIMNTTEKSSIISKSEDMYIINDCNIFLSPDKESKIVNNFKKGSAVHIEYEWGNWYYTSLYKQLDANDIVKGWLNKENVGNLKQLKTLVDVDVLLKENSTVIEKSGQFIIDNNTTWGTITEVKNSTYMISFPGASYGEVDKSNVKFIHSN
jgi:hypothetical protein